MRAQRLSLLTSITSIMVLVSAAGVLPAQTLPAIGPTQIAPITAVPNQPGDHPHRAEVTCANGQLEVHAHNSSLNSILQSLASCTGMRITGGVPEQRVFGDYGPAAPATILATLLDGTGSNMLLKEAAAGEPAQLVLTPRTGGPTPPSPASYRDTDADSDEDTNSSAIQGPPNALPNRYLRNPYSRSNPQAGQSAGRRDR